MSLNVMLATVTCCIKHQLCQSDACTDYNSTTIPDITQQGFTAVTDMSDTADTCTTALRLVNMHYSTTRAQAVHQTSTTITSPLRHHQLEATKDHCMLPSPSIIACCLRPWCPLLRPWRRPPDALRSNKLSSCFQTSGRACSSHTHARSSNSSTEASA
jgi:hypothetical protein